MKAYFPKYSISECFYLKPVRYTQLTQIHLPIPFQQPSELINMPADDLSPKSSPSLKDKQKQPEGGRVDWEWGHHK